MIGKEIVIEMEDIIDSVISAVAEGSEITVSGCGASMSPYIEEGRDLVVLGKADISKVRCGEIYLYRRHNGRYAIHRVYCVHADTVDMLGDSQYFIERGISKSSIIAVAIRLIRPDGTVELTDDLTVRCSAVTMRKRIRRRRLRGVLSIPARVVRRIGKIIRNKI